jgi:hypothetical protein
LYEFVAAVVEKCKTLPPVTAPEVRSTVSQAGSELAFTLKNAFGTELELMVTGTTVGVVAPTV